jgi:hypothetical protein
MHPARWSCIEDHIYIWAWQVPEKLETMASWESRVPAWYPLVYVGFDLVVGMYLLGRPGGRAE